MHIGAHNNSGACSGRACTSLIRTRLSVHQHGCRRIAGNSEDAELIGGVVEKLDEVKDQLDDLVCELGYADFQDYVKVRTPAPKRSPQDVQKNSKARNRGALSAERPATSSKTTTSPSGSEGPFSQMQQTTSRGGKTQPLRAGARSEQAACLSRDAIATPPPDRSATVTAGEYESLIAANTEMKEQQRLQRREIYELREALFAIQSQSFVSPIHVMGDVDNLRTTVANSTEMQRSSFVEGLHATACEPPGPSTVAMRSGPAEAAAETNEETMMMVSPMMAYEDLVDFELQRLHAIVDQNNRNSNKIEKDNASDGSATALMKGHVAKGELELPLPTPSAAVNTAPAADAESDTFLVRKSDLDAMISERISVAIEAEFSKRAALLLEKREVSAEGGGDVSGDAPDCAFSRLMDAIVEDVSRRQSPEEERTAARIDGLRAVLQEKTSTLSSVEASLADTVIPSLKRFDVFDESLLMLSRNVNEVYAKLEGLLEKGDSEDMKVAAAARKEEEETGKGVQRMLELFDTRLKDIEDAIAQIAAARGDAAISEADAGDEVSAQEGPADEARLKKGENVGKVFLSDPTMKDMIRRLKHLEQVVKLICSNDYRHLKTFKSFYERDAEGPPSFGRNIGGSIQPDDEIFFEEDGVGAVRFGEHVSSLPHHEAIGHDDRSAEEVIRDEGVVNREKPYHASLLGARHLAKDLSRPASAGLRQRPQKSVQGSSSAKARNDKGRGLRESSGNSKKNNNANMPSLSSPTSSSARKLAEEALSRVASVQAQQERLERKVLVLLKTEGESRRMNILELWRKVKEVMDGINANAIEAARKGEAAAASQPRVDDCEDHRIRAGTEGDKETVGKPSNAIEFYIEQVAGNLRGSISAVDAKAERLRSALTAVRRTALLADAKCGAVAAEFCRLYRQVDAPVTCRSSGPPASPKRLPRETFGAGTLDGGGGGGGDGDSDACTEQREQKQPEEKSDPASPMADT